MYMVEKFTHANTRWLRLWLPNQLRSIPFPYPSSPAPVLDTDAKVAHLLKAIRMI